MTANFDLANYFAALASHWIKAEAAARKKSAENMLDGTKSVDTHLMREAMKASAWALPYRTVLENAETAGIHEALRDMRNGLTRQLLTRAPGSSTCQIRNESARLEIEAAQDFLGNTDRLLDDDETPAEEPAPAVEPQPEPAPSPAKAPKATPAQKRTLAAIRDNGVTLRWSGHSLKSRTMVHVERGDCPRVDMVEWAISQGWARWTSDAPMSKGRGVALTETGEAILGS
ncbi:MULTISPECIES: hypothetical protein [Streptomyces]|uniref:Uncharacterized protein n=1 Tax=Streptomyces sp. 900129855 TaxID=3155129 RepID=A0ABV2ZRQ8_9ACTN